MIYKNNENIGFIYKNNENIDKIYKNNELIFEQGFTREQTGVPPITTTYQAIGKNLKDYKIYGNSVQGKLPDTYQQVEYIESTGTQYIDTGINVNTTTSRYETKINPNLVSDTRGIFGTRNHISSNLSSMNVFIINGVFRLDWLTGAGNYNVNNISSNTEYTISITRGLATINNVDYTSEETTSVNSPYTFYIGNFNNAGSAYSNGFSGKIYYSKLYNNNILVFDGIPCYRKSDNEIGMYDLVTNTFFTNAGTGTFNKGADTPTQDVPIEIESVGDLITDINDINYGKYKIPVIVGNITTSIYLDEPLRKVGDYSDYIDFKNQKEFRNVIVNDDTGTQTIENSYTGTTDSSGTSISLPNIPTIKGTTIFEIDTEIQPSSMYIKYKGT